MAHPPKIPENQKYAVLVGDSPIRLWGLTSTERLRRQLQRVGIPLWQDRIETLPATASLLILRGDYMYDGRVISGLAKVRQPLLLEISDSGTVTPVAAHVGAAQAHAISELISAAQTGAAPAGVVTVGVEQIAQWFEEALSKLDRPFVLPVHAVNRHELEQIAFSGAYKGITDLVTKWVWPTPAQWMTRFCIRMGFTPNHVTTLSLVLAIAAGVLFAHGEFGWGLLAGWIMTFLDTVDGKLARVTITYSRFGRYFDHIIDLIHPPFWYLAWGFGVALNPDVAANLPLSLPLLYWIIFAGYIGGRLCESAFQLWIASFKIFIWRPFDSYNRLITARRNPNLILLTAGLACGRPDLGLLAVAGWTALSTAILLLRLLQAAAAKASRGVVYSWLTEIGGNINERTWAVRLFTRFVPVDRRS